MKWRVRDGKKVTDRPHTMTKTIIYFSTDTTQHTKRTNNIQHSRDLL